MSLSSSGADVAPAVDRSSVASGASGVFGAQAPAGLRSEPLFDVLAAGLASALALGLYVLTLAPTFTWGDDVTLTIAAAQGAIRASAGSHPLWVALAHLMTYLPVGDLAYRVNLLSALAAAITLAFLYLSARRLEISRLASFAGVLALAVSHTFWAHAVRAEVYTATMAMLSIVVWLALSWWRGGRERYLGLLGVFVTLALAAHVLTLLYWPAVAWLLLASRRPGRRGLALLVGGAVAGAIPLTLLLLRDRAILNTDLVGLFRWALLTFEGYDFGSQMFQFAPATFVSDTVQWLAYLVYQFAGAGLLLLALGAIHSWRRWPKNIALFVALLYAVPALFAFAYAVGDRYVFYLPSYLAAGLWIALGFDGLLQWLPVRTSNPRLGRAAAAMLMILLFCVPVVSYRIAPVVLASSGLQVRESRYVPGPNSRSFLLWPPKTGYYDARAYAEEVMAALPQDSLVLADPILASPLQYLQTIESRRPDVVVRFCCWDIDSALAAHPDRPIVLADVAPEIYPVDRLQQRYVLLPLGPAHLLQPRP